MPCQKMKLLAVSFRHKACSVVKSHHFSILNKQKNGSDPFFFRERCSNTCSGILTVTRGLLKLELFIF